MRKAAKRIITVVLTVALCAGLVSTAAFAGSAVLPDLNNDKVKYVALGDSMTQGYQFTDYNESFADGHYCGFAGTSDRSYITMFANDLAEKFGAENFQLVDLTVHGFQPDELYYMFKWLKGEADDVYLTPAAQKHINWWTKDQGTENSWVFEDTKTMCETYVNSLAAADIITYDIGMNYFGTYLTDRIWGEESQQGAREDSYTYFLDKISPEASAMVEALHTKLISTFVKDEKTSSMVDNLINGVLYAYCSFIYYFDKSVECIYEVNPDVDMIVMPLFNPHQGLSFDLSGVAVNCSEIFNLTLDSLNVYVAAMNKNSTKYKYCDYENSPMSFVDELYYNAENASEDVRKLIFQTLKNIVSDAVNPIVYREAWWDACVKAVTYRTYPADLLYTFLMYGNTADVLSKKGYDIDLTRTMFDPENATDEDYLALHWELRFGSDAARGFGAHPCPLGQVEKYNTVTRAYNGESTNADVVVRTATNGFKFVSDFTNKILDFTHDLFAKIGTTLKVMFRWPNVVDTLLKFLPFIPGC